MSGGAVPPPPGAMPPPGPGYGAPPMGPGYTQPYAAKPSVPGIAIAGFICSMVGVFILPFVIPTLVGTILSSKGKKAAQQIGASTGLATAGFWVGLVFTILQAIGWLLYIILIIAVISSDTTTTEWEMTQVVAPLLGLF